MEIIKNLLWLNKANAIKQTCEWTQQSLIRILDREKIWEGVFGKIYKAKVKIGNKKKDFAIKEFGSEAMANNAIAMYHKIKKIWIPTWTTYRSIGKKSVLMTLGNKNWELVFSANNESNDSKTAKISPIAKISDDTLNKFFDSALDTSDKLSSNKIVSYFDACIFVYKDEELKLLVWDFDKIDNADEDAHNLMIKNIQEIAYAFLRAEPYFKMGEELFNKFAYHLISLQKQWDSRLKNIDINEVCNRAYRTQNAGSGK